MEKQSIDLDLFEQQSKLINQAIENFRPYTTGFLSEAINMVRGNTSDFMVELEKILYALRDEKGKTALSNASAYYEAIMGVHDAWIDVDQRISEKCKEGKEK